MGKVKTMCTSEEFCANDYLLVEMCMEPIEDEQGNNGELELYEGPCILGTKRAFTVRHAYELFRNSVKDSFDDCKVFLSELKRLGRCGEDYKYGFVVTATHIKTHDVSSHQFFIVKDTPHAREQLELMEKVDL